MKYNKSYHQNDPTPLADNEELDCEVISDGIRLACVSLTVARDFERELNWWKQQALETNDALSRIQYPDTTGQ